MVQNFAVFCCVSFLTVRSSFVQFIEPNDGFYLTGSIVVIYIFL